MYYCLSRVGVLIQGQEYRIRHKNTRNHTKQSQLISRYVRSLYSEISLDICEYVNIEMSPDYNLASSSCREHFTATKTSLKVGANEESQERIKLEASVFRNVLINLPGRFILLFTQSFHAVQDVRVCFGQWHYDLWLSYLNVKSEIMSNEIINTYCITWFLGQLWTIREKRIYISLFENSYTRK